MSGILKPRHSLTPSISAGNPSMQTTGLKDNSVIIALVESQRGKSKRQNNRFGVCVLIFTRSILNWSF